MINLHRKMRGESWKGHKQKLLFTKLAGSQKIVQNKPGTFFSDYHFSRSLCTLDCVSFAKRPVKLIQRVKIAHRFHSLCQVCSAIFACYVKTVPIYRFKLIWVADTRPSKSKNFSKQFTDMHKITMFYS